MSNTRIIPCETCQSEGRLYVAAHDWHGPYDRDTGPCPACEATGGEVIETEPITADDFDEAFPNAPLRSVQL